MKIDSFRPATLDAVVDRLIPADAWPGALGAGAAGHVRSRLVTDPGGAAVAAALAELDRADTAGDGRPFAARPSGEQDAILARHAGSPWFAALLDWTAEGYYAGPDDVRRGDDAAWRMIGYDPRPVPAAPGRSAAQPGRRPEPGEIFDVIVVGAGAGGGVVAAELTRAGRTVLVLERGDADLASRAMARDHLCNQRYSPLGHNAGPDVDGHPRVLVDPDGGERVVRPHEAGYQNNAAGVGSGTVVYGAQAWRYHPDDFHMASRYGVPDGSSLADWPFEYDTLAPFYERAEWEIGVAGTPEGLPSPRRRGFPMPPFPGHASRAALTQGARKLGLSTVVPPLLINSVPRDGRAACAACGSCVGFACPSDAKNGTHNTALARAVASGRCVLAASAVVTRVTTDGAGRATGVLWRDARDPGAEPVQARGRCVVLCAGAIETARLLLLSATDAAPDGLGNGSGFVGRNLQGHFSPMVYGRFADPVYDPRGPGVTVATCDYNHGNPGVIGGAMIADDFVMLPIIFWKRALPPEAARWGLAGKSAMREAYRHVARLYAPVQEIPNPECRVTLDPRVRDRHGLPVARLSGRVHPETVRTAAFMRARAEEWLVASGAVETWGSAPAPALSGGQHQAGTCRMGTDPDRSVTDPVGRVWGTDNLFVADGSLHPTNGGFNPVLTILALAYRVSAAVDDAISCASPA